MCAKCSFFTQGSQVKKGKNALSNEKQVFLLNISAVSVFSADLFSGLKKKVGNPKDDSNGMKIINMRGKTLVKRLTHL